MDVNGVPVSASLLPRRSANFHPTIWGDYFLKYSTDAKENLAHENIEEFKRLKEEIIRLLTGTLEVCLEKLELIDSIQRLGIGYHFENEIKTVLKCLNDIVDDFNTKCGNNLYIVALCFRLLRQHGYYLSCDVFKQFKNSEGEFDKDLVSDITGLLSLYEASHYLVRGEDILEEALTFTTTHLQSMASNSSGLPIERQVHHALKHPIQKTLTRLGARLFIPLYQENEAHNKVLLNFAKLDFNILQKLHQKELSELTRWWKELDFATSLPFARDRLVECYFWILGVYFEPQYSTARRMLTKATTMTSVIDDIYDVYATLDELLPFTKAIERWSIDAINEVPLYLRHFYKALLDVYSEMENELAKEGKTDLVIYPKGEMNKLVRSYLKEAHWFHSGYVPTMEEYMNVALVTSGYMMLPTHSFVGMDGNLINKAVFEWAVNEPLIVRAASTICRLMDDMAGHEFEQERGHVASAVECYMNQHGASKEEAIDEFRKQVKNAWKDINKECLTCHTVIPAPLLERVVNLARVIHLLYQEEDSYTHSTTKFKGIITSVLIDPVP